MTQGFAIRDMEPDELRAIYKRVRRDFPPIEYPPLPKMQKNLEWGAMTAQLYEENGCDAAYAFVLRSDSVPACMLFLYAVEPRLRGRGVGSAFLQALLNQRQDLDGMYAEVEMAELAQTPQEKQQCEKRIAFYEALGFRRIEGLHYSIYGVRMHLFYRPLRDKTLPNAGRAIRETTELYNGILRPWERHNLKVKIAE